MGSISFVLALLQDLLKIETRVLLDKTTLREDVSKQASKSETWYL
jgi:hypothetical protein